MEATSSFITWSPPISDRVTPVHPPDPPKEELVPESSSPLEKLPQLAKKQRLYKALPIREPFKPAHRYNIVSFHNSEPLSSEAYISVMKPWPGSLTNPRKNMPQTSSLLWGRPKKTSPRNEEVTQSLVLKDIRANQNESRQTQLSEFKWSSPYMQDIVSSHLRDLDPGDEEEMTHFQLPDKSYALVTAHLEGILKDLTTYRMIQSIVKFLYSETSANPGFSGVFKYVFCLNRRRPIEKLEDCPIDTTTLVIASNDILTMNRDKAGFDPVGNSIINMERLDPGANNLLPISSLMQKSESLTKLVKRKTTEQRSLPRKKPLMVPSCILSTVDLPPFLESEILRKSIREKVQSKISTRRIAVSSTIPSDRLKSVKSAAVTQFGFSNVHFKESQNSSRPVLEVSDMLVTSKPISTAYIPGDSNTRSLPLSLGRLAEANAGFRRKPDPLVKLSSPVKLSHSSRTASIDTAIKTLKTDAKMKKSLVRLSDQIMRQLDVEAFCARYSLTVQEFVKLLEEFAILALSGYDHLPPGTPEGVQVAVLCNYYKVSIEALRGVNQQLFDYPASDSLDVMRVISPSVLVKWMDFVTFYSLAIRQRAQLIDLVPFLLRVTDTQAVCSYSHSATTGY